MRWRRADVSNDGIKSVDAVAGCAVSRAGAGRCGERQVGRMVHVQRLGVLRFCLNRGVGGSRFDERSGVQEHRDYIPD